MIRTIGRIILIGVGVALIAQAIPVIISNYQDLTVNGWDWEYILTRMDLISSLISQIANVSFGATALFAAITGRASFRLFWGAIIMIAIAGWFFYSSYKAGTLNNWQTILQAVLSFALPILYFIGTIFMCFNSHKQSVI